MAEYDQIIKSDQKILHKSEEVSRGLHAGRSPRALVTAAIFVFGAGIVGCGGGAEPQPVNVKSLVIASLPGVRSVEPPLPEPCGPVSELKEAGGKAALSQRFVLERGEAVEAAAIFKGEKPARAAYRALGEPSRLRCIAAAIENFTGQPNVSYQRPQPFHLGDEAAVARYRISDPSSGRTGYSSIISLRVGRCTASILVSSEDQAAVRQLAGSTSRAAAGLLSKPCS